MWSVHSRRERNPAWFSRICFSRRLVSLPRTIPVSRLDATFTELIPLWFSHEVLSPFLQIRMISAEHYSDGTSSLSHMKASSLVNAMVSASPPSLKSVGESPSDSAALLRFSRLQLPRNLCYCGGAYVYIPLWVWIITTECGGGFRPAELFLEVFRPTDEDDDAREWIKVPSFSQITSLWVCGALYTTISDFSRFLHFLCLRNPTLLTVFPEALGQPSRGGQQVTWRSNMKKIPNDLAVTGGCRLPGWGPRDSPQQWLRTSQDIAQNRQQWRTCSHSITTK